MTTLAPALAKMPALRTAGAPGSTGTYPAPARSAPSSDTTESADLRR